MTELKPLTPQQEIVIEALFSGELSSFHPKDRFRAAMRKAGFSDNYLSRDLRRIIKDHLAEATREFLAEHGPNAAMTMVNVMAEPSEGARDMLNAAKEILDRGVGVVKTDKLEIDTPKHGIFILPAKKDEEDE